MVMLKLSLTLIIVLLTAVSAEAQRRPAPSRTLAQATKNEPLVDKHYFAGVLYSTANQIDYKGQVELFSTPTDFTATEKTTGSAGVTGGYIFRQTNAFGFSADLTYELPRPSNGIEGSAGNMVVTGTYDDTPSNSLVTAGLNANYSFSDLGIYVFGGVNYPFTIATGNGMSMTGLPGYQLGGGLFFTDSISGEFSYRTVRLKGTIEAPPMTPLEIDEASFSGFVFAVHYLF
jgi:hypothetical protein